MERVSTGFRGLVLGASLMFGAWNLEISIYEQESKPNFHRLVPDHWPRGRALRSAHLQLAQLFSSGTKRNSLFRFIAQGIESWCACEIQGRDRRFSRRVGDSAQSGQQ